MVEVVSVSMEERVRVSHKDDRLRLSERERGHSTVVSPSFPGPEEEIMTPVVYLGPPGKQGQPGPEGKQGPPGTEPDLPNLLVLFENKLY